LAAGGKRCLLGRNCNSRGAAALGLNLKYEETMNALLSGEIKAAYMAGYNPVRVRPKLAKVLSDLDLLVVQDLYLSETAQLADVVFPAASFAEIEGTFLGPKGKMLPLRHVIPPVGKPDWQILAELGKRMGPSGFDYFDHNQVAEEMLAHGMAEQINPLPETFEKNVSQKRKPLLIHGPSIFQFGSGTRTSKIFDLQYLTRVLEMEINPEDAKQMGIKQSDTLRMDWDRGSAKAHAKISRRVLPGVFRISGMESEVHEVRVKRDA
jgi:predicted molibdopterin-dependent oxidoreductase YjgC